MDWTALRGRLGRPGLTALPAQLALQELPALRGRLALHIPTGAAGPTGATDPTGAAGAVGATGATGATVILPALQYTYPAATVTAAAPVADATSAEDVVERFNELLANLRAAGLLATDNA